MTEYSDLVGNNARLSFEVTEADTALALLSGDVPVLATPRLIAWVEAATVACVNEQVPAGITSVGVRVDVEHKLATPLEASVEVRAALIGVVGKRLDFEVSAAHWVGQSGPQTVLVGRISRVLVERDRFLAGAGAASGA